MQTIVARYRGASVLLSVVADRTLIPLAVVIGLLGGALIGAEIVRLQSVPVETIY